MESFADLLVAVWREVCRHPDLAASTAHIAKLLVPQMPVELLLVRRLEKERASVQTVGVGLESRTTQLMADRTDCSPAQMTRLLAWCRQGDVTWRRHDDRLTTDLAPAVPLALQGDLVIGPLASAQGTYGLLLLLARAQPGFTPDHVKICQALLEPFAAALENDRKWGALTTLYQAAEADKQSLLRRLGQETLAQTTIGADSGLRLVMGRVTLVSRSEAPVLLLGEPGSGKEVIARAIHSHSSRAAGPFLRVNCGAMAPEAIDAALFGQEQGPASTGPIGPGNRWFERANGGTLFLDEIGELPPASQVRLLRVLQEGTFKRVGGRQSIKVDIRLIAATQRDLAAMVQRGLFRQDLWYHIAAFPIVLPPLRERPEDIPALAAHFVQRAAVRLGLRSQPLSAADISRLNDYGWPGNVRELAVVMERAVLLGEGRSLAIAQALGASPDVDDLLQRHDETTDVPRYVASVPVPLDMAMKQHIEAALTVTQGRVEGPHGAARLLKINPYTLRGRMRKLGIDWHMFRAVREDI